MITRTKHSGAAVSFGVLVACCVSNHAPAQSYPVRPIRLVVPFPAGGVNDIVARIVAQKMAATLGQQTIVDNRPGAGGNIGTDLVAKAAPDGYTLLSGGMGSLVMNPLVSKLPYDPVRDFAPIIAVATSPNVLAVHPSLPARSVKDLVALARTHPGRINYGSGGVGSTPHLSAALFGSMTGVNIVHIPYKGAAPATTDLVAGHVQLAFLGIPATYPHIKSNRLRALAVTGAVPSPALPGVPTVAASGVPGYEMSPWYGVLAPAGVSRDIVSKLNGAIAATMRDTDTRDRLQAAGADAATSTPEEFAERIKNDLVKWLKVITEAGIKSD